MAKPDPIYLTLDPMADPGPHRAALENSPGDIKGVSKVVQGLMLHQHWANAYGQTLSKARQDESHLRSVRDMLDQALKDDPAPLTAARAPETRLIGVCRHFTQLAVGILREHGVAARARCGFGAYFDPRMKVDHWVVEYWDEGRWKMADAQIDAVQRGVLKPDFDLYDVPRDRFIVAGQAWQACRAGRDDPETYGIFDMHGLWFIAGNVWRDAAALNNDVMLPWDVWGGMPDPGPGQPAEPVAIAEETLAYIDHLAALTVEPDAHIEELKALYRDDARLRVPGWVMNVLTGQLERV